MAAKLGGMGPRSWLAERSSPSIRGQPRPRPGSSVPVRLLELRARGGWRVGQDGVGAGLGSWVGAGVRMLGGGG
jgi:hypothetical protein